MRTRSAWLLTAALLTAAVDAEGLDRIRAPRRDAATLLESARQESRTVRELLEAIARTDVIVYVELARHPSIPRGGTVLLTAVPAGRYLLVTINPDHDRIATIAYLGHELQHVLEIATSPHVTDQVSLRRLFQRIGTDPAAMGNFETETAEVIGRRVWNEVSSAAAGPDTGAAQSARPMRSWSFSR
jgi:hypothetical protein